MPYMEEDIDYWEELNRVRHVAAGLERDGQASTLEAYWEVCCGDVLVAESNMENQDREWENASLAEELIDIVAYLEEYDYIFDNLYSAVSRMAEVIFDHPRLKLRLLEMELLLLQRIEIECGHEVDMGEDVENMIFLYRHNIDCADRGDFDAISPSGHLKCDPIEWSADYERVIDEANKKIYSLLEDHPRGMGFCFSYWHTKAEVLRDDYGIIWRSPAIMNPGVIFD